MNVSLAIVKNPPLAIVKARINNWRKVYKEENYYTSLYMRMACNRIRYYKKLHRKIELEQFFGVKLP
jgi:hypothetical protein